MSLYIRYTFITVSEDDLCFSREEQDEYLEKQGIRTDPAQREQLWNLIKGYPLALRLLAVRGGSKEGVQKDLWNYLENHVYDQWDIQMQNFLMETSVVDSFTTELAGMITGNSNVASMLVKASELGNFFSSAGEEGIWQYRKEMRQSMRARLEKNYSPEKVKRIYYHAGLYYEMHDQIPKALEMYEKYGDSDSISRVLAANARKNPANGHYYEMKRYYLALPEEAVKESPVLMAGMSMLQSMLMNEEESERWYRELAAYAASHSGSAGKEARGRLLYLDIGLPHRGSVGLTEIFKNAGFILRQKGAALPEFSVTSNLPSMLNGGKDFCEWTRRDREIAASLGKIVEFVLGKYGKGLVPLALAESFLEKGADSYEIMSLAEKGKLSADSGGKIEQSFVAAGILVWLSILNGNADYAGDMLEVFRKRAQQEAGNLLPNIDAFRCRIWLYQGKSTQAAGWQEQLIFYAEKMKRTYISMESELLRSIVMQRLGIAGWEDTLQSCISRAESYRFVRLITREGTAVKKLFDLAEITWKDRKFRDQVLSECTRMGEFYPYYLMPGNDGKVSLPENALRILRMQAKGYSMKEIAARLNISEATVNITTGKLTENLV